MFPSRNIDNVFHNHGENHSMFLRRLSSFGPSFLPRSHLAVCRGGFRSSSASFTSLPQLIRAPRPWWSVRGFPPWHTRLPHTHPTARQVFTSRTLHPHKINPTNFSDGRRHSFSTSAGLFMERHGRDREPPHKRRKNEEERRSSEGGGHRGTAKDGSSKREHHHPDHRQNHHFRDEGQDKGKYGAGKGVSRENSRDKDVERTKPWNKDRQRKDSDNRDESLRQTRSKHQEEGHKESQSALSRAPKSNPEQGKVPVYKPKPNPWFKERGAEEQGGLHRNTERSEKQSRERSSDEGPWTRVHSRPCSTPHPTNPWQRAGVTNRELPPPGTSPPVRQQDKVLPVKPLQRHWENSPACTTYPLPPGDSTVFDFSVMSYNILSQELLQDNAYLYRHCDPSVLPWEYRLPNLLAEIQQHDADILCLQEVQEDHYENQIKPALQTLGYQCEYKKRTGGKPDGCAIIFKSSRLSLLSSNPVEFFRRGDALLNRDNVGLVVLLQPRDAVGRPHASICVANTHLLYNPRRGDIKLAQLAILLAEINRLSRLPDGSTNPVVLCGDFNSTPWSPLYSFLTTGCLDYQGLPIGMVSGQESIPRGQRVLMGPIWSHSLGVNQRCQYEDKPASESSPPSPTAVEGAISNLTVEDLATKSAASFHREKIEHGLKLQSSYQHRLMPDGRPEITTCHSRTAITVDYILFTPNIPVSPSLPSGRVRGLQLMGRLSLVGQSELEDVNSLPNQHHSSDHLPLLARFRFRH